MSQVVVQESLFGGAEVKQYTNLDKVELSRAFPDIVAMKNNGIDGKNPLRVPNQGYLELYSNFGFMHVT